MAPVPPSEARPEGLAALAPAEAGPEGLSPAERAAANLEGAARAWREAPEWMDFLRPDSPAFAAKRLERELYLRHWAACVPPGCVVLDVGGGIGRFATWCLDLGCEVHLVDPDAESLACAVRHAAGRPGTLHVYRAEVDALPALPVADVVLAAELLCYVPDPAAALAALRRHLRPGGPLLLSVEARYGWALSVDAPPGQLGALLGDGLVHAPGDRFVRTFTEADLRALLAGWTVERLVPSHYVLGGPLQQVAGELDRDTLFAYEDQLREHPIFAPLNRALLAIAR